MLKIKAVSLDFGGVAALRNINICVEKGTIHAVIGPNGAGKTTLLNCISGFYKPKQGTIFLDGQEISPLPPYVRAGLGLARVFQNVELFHQLTVLENIYLGRHYLMKYNMLQSAIFFGKACREELKHRERVEEIIDFLEIEAIRKKKVGGLPYGLRKKVELARALAMEPKVLLLDEPTVGMNKEEKEDTIRYVLDIHREMGTTILLIEHDMQIVSDISDVITVLNFGQQIVSGKPEKVLTDKEVIKVYLGSEEGCKNEHSGRYSTENVS